VVAVALTEAAATAVSKPAAETVAVPVRDAPVISSVNPAAPIVAVAARVTSPVCVVNAGESEPVPIHGTGKRPQGARNEPGA
jgi:hypothetical protein